MILTKDAIKKEKELETILSDPNIPFPDKVSKVIIYEHVHPALAKSLVANYEGLKITVYSGANSESSAGACIPK